MPQRDVAVSYASRTFDFRGVDDAGFRLTRFHRRNLKTERWLRKRSPSGQSSKQKSSAHSQPAYSTSAGTGSRPYWLVTMLRGGAKGFNYRIRGDPGHRRTAARVSLAEAIRPPMWRWACSMM